MISDHYEQRMIIMFSDLNRYVYKDVQSLIIKKFWRVIYC